MLFFLSGFGRYSNAIFPTRCISAAEPASQSCLMMLSRARRSPTRSRWALHIRIQRVLRNGVLDAFLAATSSPVQGNSDQHDAGLPRIRGSVAASSWRQGRAAHARAQAGVVRYHVPQMVPRDFSRRHQIVGAMELEICRQGADRDEGDARQLWPSRRGHK